MMKLAHFVADEQLVSVDRIMLLRHADGQVALLSQFGVSIEEYTSLQPEGGRFDFHCKEKHDVIYLVVVVIGKLVHAVYRIGSNHTAGKNDNPLFVGQSYANFQAGKKCRILRKFSLESIPSYAVQKAVVGWEGREIAAVLHSKCALFEEICVDTGPSSQSQFSVWQRFAEEVAGAREGSRADRLARLAVANPRPERILVSGFAFKRNADVVNEVLFLADGICQRCGSQAPFNRRSNDEPYLEVHHRRPLSEHGDDTVDNAIALCPNCHRRFHFGDWADRTD